MTTNEALAKLKTMASKAGEALYERITLTAKILKDREWIDAEFAGDYDKAHEAIEVEYFPEMTAFGLGKLLDLLATFPDVATWRAHKFNLQRLWAERTEQRQADRGESKPRTSKTEKIQADADARVEKEVIARSKAEDVARERDARVIMLEARIKELEAENHQMRGELAAMRRMLSNNRREKIRRNEPRPVAETDG